MPENKSQTLRILNLGVEEIFEDLTYNVAYDVVLKKLKDNGMDDGILKQAIDSGITIMFSSALMLYIQKQEEILQRIIKVAAGLFVTALSPVSRVAKGLLGKFKKVLRLVLLVKL